MLAFDNHGEGILVCQVCGGLCTHADAALVGARDSSLLIWCEECGARTEIRFVQHKGTTYVEINPMDSPVSEIGTDSISPRFTIR